MRSPANRARAASVPATGRMTLSPGQPPGPWRPPGAGASGSAPPGPGRPPGAARRSPSRPPRCGRPPRVGDRGEHVAEIVGEGPVLGHRAGARRARAGRRGADGLPGQPGPGPLPAASAAAGPGPAGGAVRFGAGDGRRHVARRAAGHGRRAGRTPPGRPRPGAAPGCPMSSRLLRPCHWRGPRLRPVLRQVLSERAGVEHRRLGAELHRRGPVRGIPGQGGGQQREQAAGPRPGRPARSRSGRRFPRRGRCRTAGGRWRRTPTVAPQACTSEASVLGRPSITSGAR